MTQTDTIRRIGSKVSVDHPKYPGVWIVKSRGPVNSVLQPVDGGRALKVPHTMLIDPTETPAVRTFAPTLIFSPGEFVRLNGGKFAGLWIVISDKGAERVNVAKPGGDGDRYLRAPRRDLVRVAVEDVLK